MLHSWGKHLALTEPLSTLESKWVAENSQRSVTNCMGSSAMDYDIPSREECQYPISHPGRSVNTQLVTSCCRKLGWITWLKDRLACNHDWFVEHLILNQVWLGFEPSHLTQIIICPTLVRNNEHHSLTISHEQYTQYNS